MGHGGVCQRSLKRGAAFGLGSTGILVVVATVARERGSEWVDVA